MSVTQPYTSKIWKIQGPNGWYLANFADYIRAYYPCWAALGLFTWEDIFAYVSSNGYEGAR